MKRSMNLKRVKKGDKGYGKQGFAVLNGWAGKALLWM